MQKDCLIQEFLSQPPKPMTDPPAKATSSALPRLSLAALVVRTFTLVATTIPKYPAKAEQNAPTIKKPPHIRDYQGYWLHSIQAERPPL